MTTANLLSTTTTSPDSRLLLIQAAAEAFMEEGYRASIDRIAQRAGVARQTVYNHFSSKDDLFSEVANIAACTVLIPLEGEGGDTRERLLRFGLALRGRLLGDDGLAMFRTIAAETQRFPALAAAFFDKGPGQTLARLTDFLSSAMDAGSLRRDDPKFAGEMLLSMLDGFDRTRRLLGSPQLSPERENDRAARIVDCFLRGYTPAK
jgi:TetR/AcrR family transcriptional regulator, mexJK operon transcriptional repressor